jgi:DNA repair protein RadC
MPGLEDINATSALTKACKLIGIEVVDHLVISAGSYCSFADERTEKFNKKS